MALTVTAGEAMMASPAPAAAPMGSRDGAAAEVRVVMRGQRFFPARVESTVGDTVVFVLESGAPHNVAFERDSIPAGALSPLARALGGDEKYLFSKDMVLIPGETIAVATAELPPGRYVFYCAPHYGGGMRGELVLRAR
ncbi:MAG: hypothetical protein KF709_13060 [Gemmatimonadaceae bacterium]|nr:hypothetical protein [Gemmatimonadaceae bacterium]